MAFLACCDAVFFCVGTSKAFHGLVEVDEVAVELGSVDTGELHLVSDSDTAGTAHAGAVNHHGVKRHHGGKVILLGKQRDKLHHWQGSDRYTTVVVFALLNQLFNLVGDKTFLAVAAIVGNDVEVVADGTHLLLEEDKPFVA